MTSKGNRSARRRPVAITVAAVAVTAVVAAVVVLVTRGDDEVAPPYTDPAAVGVVGLCDAQGKAVRSGSTRGGPLARLAVGSTAATGVYAGAGRTATLYAFQPRAGVDPSGWSGRQLTAASRYTNPRHPMVEATPADTSLQSFLAAYPATQSGFVQLRLYPGAAGEPLATTRYDATDIRVTGSTWQVARRSTFDEKACRAGSATSLETSVEREATGTATPITTTPTSGPSR